MHTATNAKAIVRSEWLTPYLKGDFDLFPLKRPVVGIKKNSKVPRDSGYKTQKYTSQEIEKAIDDGFNIGFILPEDILVIDADPRNYADKIDSLARLNEALGKDITLIYPTVKTGDGYHIYMRIPKGLRVHKALTGYAGIDFLSKGRYVLCAGCLHYKGVHYAWYHGELPDLTNLPDAPEDLLESIKRTGGKTSSFMSELSEDEADLALVASLLDLLPIEDFREHEQWFSVLCAVHYGTHGGQEGLALFLNWSLSDPYYAEHEEVLRMRWASLSTDRDNAITLNTLIAKAREVAPDETNALIGKLTFKALSSEVQKTLAPYGKDTHQNNGLFIHKHYQGNALLLENDRFYYYDTASAFWSDIPWRSAESLYQRDLRTVNVKQSAIDTGLRGLRRELFIADAPNPCRIEKCDGVLAIKPFKESTVILKNAVLFPQRYLQAASRPAVTTPVGPSIFTYSRGQYNYDATAQCPKWLTFLEGIWGDDGALKQQLQEFFGYCLLDDSRFQKIGLFIGASRAGKSLITYLLSEMLNQETVATLTLSRLDKEFALGCIVGKKLVTIPEAEGVRRGQETVVVDLLKSISGGDHINVARKFESDLRIEATQKILMVSNGMPNFIDSADALLNRLLVFPFTRSFMGREDPNLKPQLAQELPGILNWALKGLSACIGRNSLFEAEAGHKEKEIIQERTQPLALFFEDCCVIEACGVVPRVELYQAYQMWCAREEIRYPLMRPNFMKALHALYPRLDVSAQRRVNGKPVRAVVGISLMKGGD